MFEPKPDNEIYVVEIKDTKDAESKQIRLSQYREKSPEENAIGFLMSGHSKFTSQIAKKTLYASVSQKNIDKWGLKEGVNFRLACEGGKFKDMRIQRVETTTPRVWKENGQLRVQTPKTAGTGGDVLTINGKPIYQNTILSFKGDADVLIKHNGSVTPQIENGNPVYAHDAEETAKAIRTQIKRKNSGFTEADLATVQEAEEVSTNQNELELNLEEGAPK